MPSNRSSGGSTDHRRRPPSKDSDEDAPPTNTLWVGSLSSDTVDLDLLDLFSKHGALDCSMMRTSRSYAFVYFKNSDEAKAARDALQGTVLHGSAIKIDYAIPSKPCKRIWIGGISSSTRKEEIENEFVKFGKIEEYKFYRDRNSALIDYFKTDDAIAAKKNMNGKQLGGEQIRVDFLRPHPFRKEWASHHDSRDGHFSRNMGPPEPWISGPKRLPRRDGPPSSVLWIGHPPSVHIDEDMLHNAMILFGEIERVKCFPERHYSFVEFRSVNEARRAKEGLQGRLFNDPRIQIMFSNSELAPRIEEAPPLSGPGRHLFDPRSSSGLLPYPGSNSFVRPFPQQGIDPHEFGNSIPHFPDGDLSTWVRRSPSVPGMNPSGPYIRPPFIPMPGGWDGFDTREPKRSRFEGGSSSGDPFPHARRMDAGGDGDHYGFSQPDRGTLGQIQPNRAVVRGHGQLHTSNVDHIWRGVIAKGGTHVCHARCLPLGKGIDSPLPGIINCSARTGLDMLARYYTEASGFDIVFFLPDSEEDFAAYTEFLQYLGQKNRAGVAKLDDGTTLFLVPPSHFLSEILNVSGPERLYGVVLKVPQQSTSSVTKQSHLAIPRPPYHHTDQQKVPDSHESYNFSQYEDETRNHNRHLHEESMPATSQVEVSLTPELIATLASLIPSNIQQRATGTIQTPLRSSVAPPSSASLMQDESMATHPHQQLAYQYNNQTSHISQFPTYSNNPNGPDHSSETFGVSTQTQYPSLNIPQASAIPVDSLHNYAMASQAGQLTASQNNQQYQMYSSSASHNNYGNVYANLVQQPKSDTSSVQVQAEGLPQPPQFSMPLPTDQLNVRLPIQEQQGSQDDPEKNQRYQSTLQFAANLLLQIQQQQQQQQQQQVNGQPAQGLGNQQ